MAKIKKDDGLFKLILLLIIFLIFVTYCFISILIKQNSKAIDSLEYKKATITVEEKFSRGAKNNVRYYITYNDVDYFVRKGNAKFEVGQKLEIIYYESRHFFQTRYTIVDARDGENVYYTLDQYKRDMKSSFIFTLIFFPIVELFFLALLFAMLYLHHKIYKTRSNKKKRKFHKKT